MAQTNPAIITLPPAAPTTASTPSPPIRLFRRDSYDSVTTGHTLTTEGIPSNLSLPQIITLSEHHVVSSEHLGLIPATPLSVRPFSPSERWSFPKPPNGARPDSELYPMMYSVSPDSFSSSEYITAPESEDPFSDFAVAESVDAHTVETFITVDTDAASHFSPVEIVCRPFIPSRDDEVAMNPGDEIRVLKRFDDGWAYAENCVTRKHGLFPIDCLRMANQDLPAFLAAKRISHYAAVTPQSRAVPRMTTVEEDHSA
ncbi:hypothetical protein EW026_g3703 [Hermanssonia centrifuga]|uniref:SH3 domain-containing protein n=1 Tax=Hermanssonia centrifuga TaxID=98765 RepID=A0A4S4KKG2_9APHY|nr:hypothetical protein EW026_g3703 [Hermanssonia centrifuga]